MTGTRVLLELVVVLGTAAFVTLLFQLLRLPVVLGYVVAGLIIGPYTAGPVAEPETVGALADIGLVFLLFAVGLQLSFGELLRVGKVAVVGGTVQVVAMVVIGYLVAVAVGFGPLESLFFGAFVSQSSSARVDVGGASGSSMSANESQALSNRLPHASLAASKEA